MEFYARKTQDGQCEVICRHGEARFFHLRVPQNSMWDWQVGFLALAQSQSDRDPYERWLRRLAQTDELHACHLAEDGLKFAFLKVLVALLRSLEDQQDLPQELRRAAQGRLRAYLRQNSHLNLLANYDSVSHTYRFGLCANDDSFQYQRSDRAEYDAIPEAWWSYLLEALPNNVLVEILVNYQLLREIVEQQSQGLNQSNDSARFAFYSFGNFSKALVAFLDQSDSVSPSWKTMNAVLSVVVENEYESLEEQQWHLQRILSSDEPPTAKSRRLESIVQHIRQDAFQQSEKDEARLTVLIGAISAYYLGRYDLEQAIHFWSFAKDTDWLLRRILFFYRMPGRYVFAAVVYVATLTTLIASSRLNPLGPTLSQVRSFAISGLIGLPFLVVLYALAVIIWRFFITRKGLNYFELLMPRLFGAIVVGLFILVFEETLWKFALQLDWLNWALVSLVAYLLSFVYIFIDVHKTLRLFPLPEEKDPDAAPISKTGDRLPSNQGDPVRRSIQTSLNIFFIGMFEAFLAVLVTSMLVFNVVLGPATIDELRSDWLSLIWEFGHLFSLGVFPRLVLLWTGLSLFVGAFVQLLWQDRQITSS